VSFLVRHLARKDRKIIGQNVFRVFGLPQHSQASKKFADQCLASSIACSMETVRYVFNPNALNLIGVEDLNEKLARFSNGQEIVFITSHLGSWELAGHVLTKASHRKFYGLAKPSKNEGFSEFLNLVRKRLDIHVLWTGKSSIVKEMMGVLKAGNILGFVMDQKPQVANSPKVQFLGIETPIVSGPASMTLHFKCPVFVIHVVREGLMSYRVLAQEISYDPLQSVEDLTAQFALEIENSIRTYPEQWCWNYRRWKSV
jgi:KDO2-lipid IV(A) lauroyltransferase